MRLLSVIPRRYNTHGRFIFGDCNMRSSKKNIYLRFVSSERWKSLVIQRNKMPIKEWCTPPSLFTEGNESCTYYGIFMNEIGPSKFSLGEHYKITMKVDFLSFLEETQAPNKFILFEIKSSIKWKYSWDRLQLILLKYISSRREFSIAKSTSEMVFKLWNSLFE